MKPFFLFEEPVPEPLCDLIINMGLAANVEQAGVHVDNKTQQVADVRNNSIAWLNDKSISELLGEYVKHANVDGSWNFHLNSFEVPQFSIYDVSQYYDWHVDMGVEQPTDTAFRKLSISINLNETYIGGDFQVEEWGKPETDRVVTLAPMRRTGAVCVFPSFINHRVTPVTAGTRYSLVGWFRGDMFK